MLSGNNLSMGILESDVPDIFGDALAVLSTWKSDHYTVDGSNNITDFANPGTLSDWATFGMSSADLVTDGDGTKWATDPLDSIVNSETCSLITADKQAAVDQPEGLIFITSLRAKQDQETTDTICQNGGWDMGLGNPSLSAWRGLTSSDTLSFRSDVDHYTQINIGLLPSPYNATQMQIGMLPDDPAWPRVGDYDPDGNVFTTPAYLTDDDVVIAWFYQESGLRCMINGTFVTLYNETYMNADGTIADLSTMNAVMALDWRPVTLDANASGPGANRFVRPNLGALGKFDYMGVFNGGLSDGRVAQICDYLLNSKPN